MKMFCMGKKGNNFICPSLPNSHQNIKFDTSMNINQHMKHKTMKIQVTLKMLFSRAIMENLPGNFCISQAGLFRCGNARFEVGFTNEM